MTAEVCILNRHAVALAADSAVSLQLASGRKSYNTVDKLFALRPQVPVALMVYGADALFDLPWETLVKMFRTRLGERYLPTIDHYARELADFLAWVVEQFPELFPSQRQEKACSELVTAAFQDIAEQTFAQIAEMRAFIDGIHPNYALVLRHLVRSLLQRTSQSNPEALEALVQQFLTDLDEHAAERYRQSIYDAVAYLPKDELAAMAESLVSLTAFKQRVTPVVTGGDESVAGPIDVAVLSKGDGFVWIKCKRYYDPSLNHPLRPF